MRSRGSRRRAESTAYISLLENARVEARLAGRAYFARETRGGDRTWPKSAAPRQAPGGTLGTLRARRRRETIRGWPPDHQRTRPTGRAHHEPWARSSPPATHWPSRPCEAHSSGTGARWGVPRASSAYRARPCIGGWLALASGGAGPQVRPSDWRRRVRARTRQIDSRALLSISQVGRAGRLQGAG
jgi:hypothetical protein